ncbi:MAG: hypothetical protein CMC63_03115 [Flavobacteriaceae bacterium]|nr:hypothetical protein [Flavobacteriaceae bacterium]
MRIINKNLFCIIFFFLSFSSWGQNLNSGKYNLSSSYIESIFYDDEGKLWIGTDEGLNLITGHDQFQFLASISNENGLLDSEIFKLQDLKNGYLAAYSINGLSIFDPNEFNFIQIELDSRPVSIYYDISKNVYWVTTEESGLKVLNHKFEIINEFLFDPLNPLSLSSSKFEGENNIVFGDEITFIGSTNGFNYFNQEQKTFKRFYSGYNGLDSNKIKGVFKFNQESLLIATINKLYIFNILSENFKPINFNLGSLNEIIPLGINEFMISNNKKIYILKINDNLDFEYKLIHEFKSSNPSRFKKFDDIVMIYNDGLDYILSFDSSSKSLTKFLINENVNDLELVNSKILIGTEFGLNDIFTGDNLVSRVDGYDELFFYDNKFKFEIKVKKSYLELRSGTNKSLINIPKNIEIGKNTLLEISEDYLFIFDNNLHVLDLNSKLFINNITSKEDYLSGVISSIKLIYNYLYLSTGNGVVRLLVEKTDKVKKSFRESIKNYEYNTLFNNKVPRSFSDIEQVGDYFFVGSENEGLSLYEKSLDNLIKRYNYQKGDSKTLSSKSIVKIFNDDINNSLLLATRGSGLFSLNFNDSIFKNYDLSDGLLSNNINDFAKINDRIWIQSGNGVNFFDNGIIRNINFEDGIDINSYHRESIHQIDDKILITGFEKSQIFNPVELIKTQSYNLKLSLLNITGYDKENIGGIISKSDSIVNLNNDISSIELNLHTNALNKNNIIQYSYKTSFGDKELKADNFENKIKLNSLPFYDSQIEVFAIDGNGNKSSNKLIVKFYNSPPWWLRVETILFYIVFSIIIIYLIVKLRENQTKKRIESQRKSKELEEARNLQNSLLPKINPDVDGYEISTFLKSATEIGGDYYDFFYEKGKYFYAICGDATGHGVISGIMVSVTKAALNGIPMSSPSKILEQLNVIVKKVNFGRLRMSLSVAKINSDSIELSSAAMPPTYYYNSQKNNLKEILVPNLPLGGIQKEKFDGIKLEFKKGDMIVMISDGLPELPNPNEELLDYYKVEQCLKKNSEKNAEEIKDALVSLSNDWSNGVLNPDDITIVVIKKAA